MVLAAIIGKWEDRNTVNLIQNIMSNAGKKVKIIKSRDLKCNNNMDMKKYILETSKNDVDILLIVFDIYHERNQNLFHDKIDIIIYDNKADEYIERFGKDRFYSFVRNNLKTLKSKGITLVNRDDEVFYETLKNSNYSNLYSYGFNSKANFTTSSIDETHFGKKIIIFLKDRVFSHKGIYVESSEYMIKLENAKIDTYNVMAAVFFAIVYGIDNDINIFNNIEVK